MELKDSWEIVFLQFNDYNTHRYFIIIKLLLFNQKFIFSILPKQTFKIKQFIVCNKSDIKIDH